MAEFIDELVFFLEGVAVFFWVGEETELAFIDTEKSGVLKDPDVQERLAASIAFGVNHYGEGEPEALV